MASRTKKASDRANASDRNEGERRGRGPSIARTTAAGKPTAYGVCKDLWSSRGEVVVKGLPPQLEKKLGLEPGYNGPVYKSSFIRHLQENFDQEAAAPFKVVRTGKSTVITA